MDDETDEMYGYGIIIDMQEYIEQHTEIKKLKFMENIIYIL